MTVGDADTSWHPQLFRAVNLEFQRLRPGFSRHGVTHEVSIAVLFPLRGHNGHTSSTYHSLGIADKVAGKSSQHPVSLPTALEGIWCDHHRRDLCSVFTTVDYADTPLHVRNWCCQWRAREGPNTQGKAERFMAETDHLLDTQRAFRQFLWKYGVKLYQRVLCSVFGTVGDPDTAWQPKPSGPTFQ